MIAGNPVSEPKQIEIIDNLVANFVAEWKQENPMPKWWQIWKKGAGLYNITQFLLNALDELILAAETQILTGPEKKAVVLAACAAIWDFIVVNALPLVLRPWAGKIKNIVIYVIIATSIDWIVQKYREGVWKKETDGEEAKI